MTDFMTMFPEKDAPLGKTNRTQHIIRTGDAKPISLRARPIPYSRYKVGRDELNRMIEQDVIEPSESCWSSPPVLIQKKDGGIRVCIYYRLLNTVTLPDFYPLPRINDLLNRIAQSSWFSSLDL